MTDSGADWKTVIPPEWEISSLRRVADVRLSNIDKKSISGQREVSVCNYTDVYNGKFIDSSDGFLRATATENQIRRFQLQPGDVLITKDSEASDDIARPAFVASVLEETVCGYHLALLRPHGIDGEFLYWALESEPVNTHFRVRANGVTRFGLSARAIKSVPLPLPPSAAQRTISDHLRSFTGLIDDAITAKRRLVQLLEEERQAIEDELVFRGTAPGVMTETGLVAPSQIPEHWEVLRAKYLFDSINVRSRTGSEELLTVSSSKGIVPRSSHQVTMFQAESYVGHKLCWPGDLVVNSLWAWSRGLGFSPLHGIVSTAYGVYRPKPAYQNYIDYWNLLLRSQTYQWQFQIRSKGIWKSRLQLTDEAFFDMPIVVPPSEEQAAIVARVKAETATVEESIRLALRQIALLQEYRTVLIADAVTGRIDLSTAASSSHLDTLAEEAVEAV